MGSFFRKHNIWHGVHLYTWDEVVTSCNKRLNVSGGDKIDIQGRDDAEVEHIRQVLTPYCRNCSAQEGNSDE